MTEKEREYRQKIHALKKEHRSLLDQAKANVKDDKMFEEYRSKADTVGKQLEKLEDELHEHLMNGESRSSAGVPQQSPGERRNSEGPHGSEEYREAFWDVMTKGKDEVANARALELVNSKEARAMAIATNQAGGYLVPETIEKTLVRKLREASIVRQLAHVLPMEPGDRRIPIVADYGQAGWLAEGAAYPESDIALDQILLGGFKSGRIIQISEELLHDSVIDIEDMVIDSFVKSFAELEEDAFINGDGTDRPTGVLERAETGVTGSVAGMISADEIYDIYYSLKRPYRTNASWLMNDQTVKIVRQLKTSDGQYIWSPGFGKEPPTLLGRPVYTSESMPTMAAGAKSILFGDFSYYKIADRQGRVMQRLNEKYADVGRVGIRMFQRTDANLALTEAIKTFEHATA